MSLSCLKTLQTEPILTPSPTPSIVPTISFLVWRVRPLQPGPRAQPSLPLTRLPVWEPRLYPSRVCQILSTPRFHADSSLSAQHPPPHLSRSNSHATPLAFPSRKLGPPCQRPTTAAQDPLYKCLSLVPAFKRASCFLHLSHELMAWDFFSVWAPLTL